MIVLYDPILLLWALLVGVSLGVLLVGVSLVFVLKKRTDSALVRTPMAPPWWTLYRQLTPPWQLVRAAWYFLRRPCLRCGMPLTWWDARALRRVHGERCPVTPRED